MRFFDSHCHLTDERFSGEVPQVLANARAAAVTGIVTIASDLEDASAAKAIADTSDGVWCTAGVHPHQAAAAPAEFALELRELLSGRKVVAIGEAGLDYHYDNSPRGVQRAVFDTQLALGAEIEKPVIVHAREADADVAAALRNARGARGVLHCFSSGVDLLETALELDWYVSFGGMITFRNYTAQDLLRRVPMNRLLIETDSPYLAPVPHRGKRNEPAFVVHTAARLAEILGTDTESVATQTYDNALEFFGLKAE